VETNSLEDAYINIARKEEAIQRQRMGRGSQIEMRRLEDNELEHVTEEDI